MPTEEKRFQPTYHGGDSLPHQAGGGSAQRNFELYPALKMRLSLLDNIQRQWHNTSPEKCAELHTWMQDCINGLRGVDDTLWETVVDSYFKGTSRNEDSVAAVNFVFGLDLDALNNHLRSQQVYAMVGKKFQTWSSSPPHRLFDDPHPIPYSQIPRFKGYVLEEFEGFADSIGTQDRLSHALEITYHHWERAEEALKLMVIYARTERELLPKFHELVANAVIKFKEHVMPGSNLGYDPLQEAARLGKLEYAAQTLRQAIEHPE